MTRGEIPSFYDTLTPMRAPGEVFDARHYVAVPHDWYLAVSDIKGSTAAVETGQHSDVNFAAAAMIAALNNLCGAIPYQFGGDGAVALVPQRFAPDARRVLAQTRRFARQEFKLDLRVGLAPMSALAVRGAEVLVGRYEPAPTSAYAVFLGDGVELMESSVKGRADDGLAALSMIRDDEDDGQPPDLTGLSCRWTPLKSTRGKMVALVVRGADHGALHAELTQRAGVPALNAATLENLQARWPPKGMLREAKARKRWKPLFLSTLLVGLETLAAYVVVKYKLSLGPFSAETYRREVMRGAVDFARSGETLALVFDCPLDRIDVIRAYLDDRQQRRALIYGMHVSDHAVMTCLVTSRADNEHVHFVDGGDGGYTKAATQLKARLKEA
jgi:hypothetical protein